jgi:hypothetical protein
MVRIGVALCCAFGLVACAAEAEDTDDAIEAATTATQVTRQRDRSFAITVAVPARVSDCTGADCADADGDGLVDRWEDAILDALRPAVTFDEDEPLMKRGNTDAFAALGRVFPRPSDPNRVVMSVLLLYAKDYGAANPVCLHAHSHAGDAERAALELELTGGGNATVRTGFTTGHEDTVDDQTRIVRGAELSELEHIKDSVTRQARWRVYSSQSKHATYMSKKHCENARLSNFFHQFCGAEDCAPDRVADPSRFTRLPAIVNAGEEGAPRITDLTAIGFAGVNPWGDERFCGGVSVTDEERAKCPDSLHKKLLKNPFGN